jgi:acetylornithine/succinyldiaminopimelate/putrescine aminotransferase
MLTNRQIFLQHVAQTSDFPYLLEISHAEGIFLYDPDGNPYVDLISGVSVSNLGHRHPAVVSAIKEQLDRYMHLMVYGEFVQSPQVRLAALLNEILPTQLDSTYFVNSGSEAVEGALKLAKRYTGRFRTIAFNKAYHGSTGGALSVMGDEYFKNAFRPVAPGTTFLDFNDFSGLDRIDAQTACVIVEPIQGEGGIILPQEGFLEEIRHRCDRAGALLIFDEIQTGMGRTGSMFAFEHWRVIPDILLLAKGFGGGMPLGAFISSAAITSVFKTNPVLGHITTFGGHPVCCAAGLASLEVLLREGLIKDVAGKEKLFRDHLEHPAIREIRGLGLFLAVELGSGEKVQKFISLAKDDGLVTDWFIFHDTAFRIAPPLIINPEQIRDVCGRLQQLLEKCPG